MSAFVTVKFNKNYSASRGPNIAGVKGETKEIRMSDALKAVIDSEVCTLVKAAPAATRKKAAGKKGAEKS